MAISRQQIRAEQSLIRELREIVGEENVLSESDELLVYECDGLPQHKHPPRAVIFPNSTEQTSEVLALLHRESVSFAPRGAGTGLSGGALAVNHGVVIELARMRKILHIDAENRIATVQTGLVNAHLSRAVAPLGLYYVPDPSSQPSCTIGGNIAENAGGIHCLKYGTTTDHVVGARVVLSDGAIVDLDLRRCGYDLLGVFVGSEGTFGIATEARVKLSPIPPAVRTLLADFTDVNDASRAVSAIIAAGVLPAALEMMDNAIIRAVEASVFTAGLPIDAEAVLLVELDGIEAGIDDEAEKTAAILKAHGARSVKSATDENERKKLWAARKGAFGAVGRLLPDVMIQDAVVPRSRLPEVLAETYRISAQYNLQLANVFHAGDGNLHPLICFDLRRGDDLERVRQAGREIMETCVRAGGSITGEHGVGLDKSIYLPLIFSDDDLSAMLQVRAAFDPSGRCNPGKIIPTPKGCGEARAVATQTMSEPLAVSPFPSGEDQGEGLPRSNFVPLPSPLPKGEGDSSLLLEGSPLPPGEDQGEGLPRSNFVPLPSPLPKGEGASSLLEGSPLPPGEDQGEGLARSNFVPLPGPLPKGEGAIAHNLSRDRSTQKHSLITARLNEARVGSELSQIVGDVGVRRLPDFVLNLRSNAPPERILEVAPASAEQAGEVMKFATREQLAVIPAGAGTWLDAGNLMSQADLILSARRLKRIIKHEPADLVAQSEAGVLLSSFQNEVTRAGQWLPIKAPDDGRSTLGGIIATGLAGANTPGYGYPRSFVIGLRAVMADGRLIKAGGNVVKNVAGYDLCKLFTGSYGTLGFITELTFKLRPLPADARTVLVSAELSSLISTAREIKKQLFPNALELLSPGLSKQLGVNGSANDYCLLIHFDGSARGVIWQTAQALRVARERVGNHCLTLDEDDDLWRKLGAAPVEHDDDLIWRAVLKPSDLLSFVADVASLEKDDTSHVSLRWQAGLADGRLRAIARAPVYHREAVRELRRLRHEAEKRGGSLVLEKAPVEIKKELDSWGSLGSAGVLMKRVKQQLDPENLFSPGRFFM